MSRTRTTASCVLAFGLLTTVVACGGDNRETGAIERGLEQIPAPVYNDALNSGVRVITIADLVAASELNDLPAPGPGRDDDEVIQWIIDLSGRRSSGASDDSRISVAWGADPSPALIGPEVFDDEISLDVGAIESYASLNAPPLSYTAYTGDVELSSSLDQLDAGVSTLGTGDDFALYLESASDLQRSGMPVRLGQSERAVAMSTSTPAIESWLDDDESTLADNDRFVEVARALDRLDAPTAFIVDGPTAFSSRPDLGEQPTPAETDELLTESGSQAIEPAFDIVGVGGAEIDGNVSIVVVYRFDTADDAAGAVDTIEGVWSEATVGGGQPIGELVALDSVSADGGTVTVVARPLDGHSTRLGESFLVQGEVMFQHR